MVRWAYKTLHKSILQDDVSLRATGADGWELVAIDRDGYGYFKRPVHAAMEKDCPAVIGMLAPEIIERHLEEMDALFEGWRREDETIT